MVYRTDAVRRSRCLMRCFSCVRQDNREGPTVPRAGAGRVIVAVFRAHALAACDSTSP